MERVEVIRIVRGSEAPTCGAKHLDVDLITDEVIVELPIFVLCK